MDKRKKEIAAFSLFTLMLLTAHSPKALAWGQHGHIAIAEATARITNKSAFLNCHITAKQLIEHVNDPDHAWKEQRQRHPDEQRAHFFHIDKQPTDWRARKEAADKTQGYLVYRIVTWVNEAKTFRATRKWDKLAEELHGLSHYLADLTQPLHLTSDYDGKAAGLSDLHAQFEGKLVKRYAKELRPAIDDRLKSEKFPPLWTSIEYRNLIFDTAEQSYAKSSRLFELSKPALLPGRKTRHGRILRPAFAKKKLWQHAGSLATEQLTLGAQLVTYTLEQICN